MPASPRCLASEDVTIICDDDATAAQSDPIRRASRRADGVSAEGYSLTLNRTFGIGIGSPCSKRAFIFETGATS